MSNTFFASDLHFGHTNAVEKFTREDGSPLRGFSSVDEMDETIIDNWNKTVAPNDRVFLLGDVVINKKHIDKARRLNGQITLILGNHDVLPLEVYAGIFHRVLPLKEFDGCILTHIPVHLSQVGPGNRWKLNVHGHLHDRHVTYEYEPCYGRVYEMRDKDYYNVSIDCFAMQDHKGMNYFPKDWDTIKKESGI